MMKNRKMMTSVLLVTAITTASVGLSACGTSTNDNGLSLASTEVVGSVESVEDNTITLTLGSVAEINSMSAGGGMGGAGGSAPEIPGGDGSGNAGGEAPSGDVPEKPEGDGSESNTGGEVPSNTSGSDDSTTETSDDAAADQNIEKSAESSDGTEASDAKSADSEAAPDSGSNTTTTDNSVFVESDTTATFTISDTSVLDDITIDDIAQGTILEVELDEDGNISSVSILDISVYSTESGEGGQDMVMGGAPGGTSSAADISYTAVNEYSEDTEVDGDSYSSTGTDENAILVDNGATATINNITVDRTSDDSTGGDNASFYGVGAALLTTDGTTYVNNAAITTDAAGGAGIFSYGTGVTYVADSTITTQQDTSGGIHAAGGGTLYAWDLNVETNGGSAAAIRSDRGGGTMVVDGGSYTSNGVGSPAVYCTADITINNAELNATGSEAVCIKGLNSLNLFDCSLTGNMPDSDQNDCTWDVILYQSMSGDSEVGNSVFNMVGGTLTSQNGGLFYTTNTECDILLSDVEINYSKDNDFFLQVTGNTNERGWGSAGANGSQCTFTGDNQEMQGTIVYDSISTLDFYMTNGSILTGNFVDDETYAGEGGDGYCNVYLDADSTWVVTADSEIDDLYNAGTIVDESGKTVSIVGTDGTVYVEGASDVTITVASYSTEDMSANALEIPSYSDYEVERPVEL